MSSKNKVPLTLLILLFIAIFYNNLVLAGFESDMNSFWNSLGSMSNTNSATSFKGQSAGYYTLGSMNIRNRNMSVNPVNIQLPSIKSGCGGIDVFTGAFSFINTDQFVALAKSIASNSVGYAFHLALSTLSPMISDTTARLQKVVDEVNRFNINSCETSMALVDGAVSLYETYSKVSCETTANATGYSSDAASAKRDCQNPSKRAHINNTSNTDTRPVNINIVWKALKDGGYVDFFGSETAEVFMNMTGSIIILENNSNKSVLYIPSKISEEPFKNALLNGGEIEIFSCIDKDTCLNTTKKKLKISNSTAFKNKIETVLTSIEGKIRSEISGYSIPLSKEEQTILNLVRFPIFKILQTSIISRKNGGVLNTSLLADISARDILQKYTEDIIEIVLKSLDQLKSKTTNIQAVKEISQNVVEIRHFINSQASKNQKEIEFMLNIILTNQEFEKALTNQFSDGVGQTLQFSNQLDNK